MKSMLQHCCIIGMKPVSSKSIECVKMLWVSMSPRHMSDHLYEDFLFIQGLKHAVCRKITYKLSWSNVQGKFLISPICWLPVILCSRHDPAVECYCDYMKSRLSCHNLDVIRTYGRPHSLPFDPLILVLSHLANRSTLKKTYSPRSISPRPSAARRISRTLWGEAQSTTTGRQNWFFFTYCAAGERQDLLIHLVRRYS